MNDVIAFCAKSKATIGFFMVFLPFAMVVASLSPMWESGWVEMLSTLGGVALAAKIAFFCRPKIFWGILFAMIWTQVFVSIAYECGKGRSVGMRAVSRTTLPAHGAR